MLEIVGLIFFLVLFGVCALLDPALLAPLEQQLWLDQRLWALALTVLLYTVIIIGGSLILRWQAPEFYEQLFAGSASLVWPGHVLLPLLTLIGGVYLMLFSSQANPLITGTLLGGGATMLCNWIWQLRARSRPPAPTEHVRIDKHAGMISVSWQPPADPRYAESRVVRTLWGEPPPMHAWIIGRAAYQGVLTSYDDRTVLPNQRYRYTIFTLDARHQAGIGISHSEPGYTLPLPEPPNGLAVETSTEQIVLRWYLLNAHAIRKVEISRYAIGSDDAPLVREVDPDPPPGSSTPEYRDVLLPSGLTFEYTLVAIDHEQQRSPAAVIRAATRVAPPEFKAEPEGRNYARLTWKTPATALEPERVVITRRLAGEPEDKPAEVKINFDELQHIDKGPDGQGLEYKTDYRYTIEIIYANLVKSEPVERVMTTGARVASIRQEDVKIQSTRRLIRIEWELPSRERITAVRVARLWEDLATGQEQRREWTEGPVGEFIDRDVEPGVLYTYAISVRSDNEHTSLPVEVQAGLLPPPAPVSKQKARIDQPDSPIQLSWDMPADPSIQGVLIVRNASRAPFKPKDGELVYKGAGNAYTDTPAAGREYWYAFFTYDSEEIYSDPALARSQLPLSITISLPSLQGKDLTVSPPRDMTVRKLVAGMLKRANIKREDVSDWRAVIVETSQELNAEQTLDAAGVQRGQTIAISFDLRPSEEEPPASADTDAAPAAPPAPDSETGEPTQ
jgi:hypothetical protein